MLRGNRRVDSQVVLMMLPKNHFFALRTRDYQEASPDVVTGMLWIFDNDVYALLDPGATLCFVTTLVSKQFDTLPDVLHELLWYLVRWVSKL